MVKFYIISFQTLTNQNMLRVTLRWNVCVNGHLGYCFPFAFFFQPFFAKYTMMTAEAALQSLSCLVSDLEVFFV